MTCFQTSRAIGWTGDRPFGPAAGEIDVQVIWQRLFAPVSPDPAALIAQGNSYTFTLTDTNDLIAADIEAQITACANYVIDLISHYISWQGTMDFAVDIRPKAESPYPDVDGIMPSIVQIGWNGTGWDNQTLMEAMTGTDSDPSKPDAGCTIYLAADGTIRNFGAPVWFDPNPQFEAPAIVPPGTHDFVGIYTHEVFHALGFNQSTVQWQEKIQTDGGMAYFNGANVAALFGGALPFVDGYDHYGNTAIPSIPISRGLMFQYGNYEGNRLDLGRIDLAVLADLGHTIKSYDGLPLFELIDTQTSLTGTGGNDALYGDYHPNSLSGLGGNDVIDGGAGDDIVDVGSGFDVADGGTGVDSISADLSAALGDTSLYWSLQNPFYSGPAGTGFTGFEWFGHLTTGNGSDIIITGSIDRDEVIHLGGGMDTANVYNGNDRVEGGDGSDFLFIDYSDATAPLDGVDVMFDPDGVGVSGRYSTANGQRSVDFTSMERFQIIGTAFADIFSVLTHSATGLYGGGGDDQLTAAHGGDVVDGGTGADLMYGLRGDDRYYVDTAGDVVIEQAGEGRDVVYASASWALSADSEVEVISAASTGGTEAIDLTGNALVQEIDGNAGANFLNGGGGADVLVGFGGDDQYFITSGTETIVEHAGGGRDVAYTIASHILDSNIHLEVLSTTSIAGTAAINLTGNAFVQEIVGNDGNNFLNGGGGADTLVGYGGDDQYFIISGTETIVEASGGGRDAAYTIASHVLDAGIHLEVLSTTSIAGTAAINLTGNAFVQEIVGNDGANILNGGGGADVLVGYGGDDTYYVIHGGERTLEAAGGGRDVVYVTLSYALESGSHVEVLSASSFGGTAAIHLAGNELGQELYGNAGGNILNGGGGADYLIGGGGGDFFDFTTALGGGNVDTIVDMAAGSDKIRLDDAVFAGLTGGALNPNAFVTGSQAADADDRIVYNSATGQLFYDADGSGAGAQILFATLAGNPPITAADFIVI